MIWISSGSISHASERRLPNAADLDWCSEEALLRRGTWFEGCSIKPPLMAAAGSPPSGIEAPQFRLGQLSSERADGASGSVVPAARFDFFSGFHSIQKPCLRLCLGLQLFACRP